MSRGRHGKSPAHGTSNTRLVREQRSFALGITQAVFVRNSARFDETPGIAVRRAPASTWRVVYVVSIGDLLAASAAYR